MDKSENGHYEAKVSVELFWVEPDRVQPISSFKTEGLVTDCDGTAFVGMSLRITNIITRNYE